MVNGPAKTNGVTSVVNTLRQRFGIKVTPQTVKAWKERVLDPRGSTLEGMSRELHNLRSPFTQDLLETSTVEKTYFFRRPELIELFNSSIASILTRKKETSSGKPTIKIWSAACSTGAEPYTLAMIINKNGWHKKARFKILGTDIVESRLQIARKGEYSWIWGDEEKAETFPDVYLDYFLEDKGIFRLTPAIVNMVKFKLASLADSKDYEGIDEIDLLITNNVLIYFDKDIVKKAAENMSRVLAREGLLISNLDLTGDHLNKIDKQDIYHIHQKTS